MPHSVRGGIRVDETGLRELEGVLIEFSKPTHLAVTPLEVVLASGFVATQEAVHVRSGRLKASGRTHSHFNGTTWEGEVEYGGPNGTPAWYGLFELNRGGTHDFFRPLDHMDEAFAEAFSEWFTRVLG